MVGPGTMPFGECTLGPDLFSIDGQDRKGFKSFGMDIWIKHVLYLKMRDMFIIYSPHFSAPGSIFISHSGRLEAELSPWLGLRGAGLEQPT